MSNVNISLKKEAYDYLKLLKGRDRSFSEVVLDFKIKNTTASQDIMRFFGNLKESDKELKEKNERMGSFRESFAKRLAQIKK